MPHIFFKAVRNNKSLVRFGNLNFGTEKMQNTDGIHKERLCGRGDQHWDKWLNRMHWERFNWTSRDVLGWCYGCICSLLPAWNDCALWFFYVWFWRYWTLLVGDGADHLPDVPTSIGCLGGLSKLQLLNLNFRSRLPHLALSRLPDWFVYWNRIFSMSRFPERFSVFNEGSPSKTHYIWWVRFRLAVGLFTEHTFTRRRSPFEFGASSGVKERTEEKKASFENASHSTDAASYFRSNLILEFSSSLEKRNRGSLLFEWLPLIPDVFQLDLGCSDICSSKSIAQRCSANINLFPKSRLRDIYLKHYHLQKISADETLGTTDREEIAAFCVFLRTFPTVWFLNGMSFKNDSYIHPDIQVELVLNRAGRSIFGCGLPLSVWPEILGNVKKRNENSWMRDVPWRNIKTGL